MARGKKWPKTIDEAVDQLISSMSEEERETLRNTPKNELIGLHHGFGTYIRNEFGLWGDNKELLRSYNSQRYPESTDNEYFGMIVDPDGFSMEIIETTWRRLQK